MKSTTATPARRIAVIAVLPTAAVAFDLRKGSSRPAHYRQERCSGSPGPRHNGSFPAGKNRLDSRNQRDSHSGKANVSEVFDKVADIIAETSEIDRDTITPDSHTIDDLGIDSLDFLDIVFAIDKEFGIKIPLEKWTQEVNEGKAPTEEYFVMRNLCAKIDELIAAKGA
jgi:acyl carrier protein